MHTIQQEIEVRLFDCTECGGFIALSSNQERGLRESHRTFYCPNGHQQHFPGATEAEKLRKALHEAELEKTRLTQQTHEAWAAEQRASDAAAKATREAARLRKRVQAGVCPCCNRTFTNLARHMASKHKDAV